MYNEKIKSRYVIGTYKKQLQATFNHAEPLEAKWGDISDWSTAQYAEYAARFRIFTKLSLKGFRVPLKNGYIIPLGKSSDKLDRLTIDNIYKVVKTLPIGIFWDNATTLIQTVRAAAEQNRMSFFATDTVSILAGLLWSGMSLDDAVNLQRDDVVLRGMAAFNTPREIKSGSYVEMLIQKYAVTNRFNRLEEEKGLPFLRGGRLGQQSINKRRFGNLLSEINMSQQGRTIYDISPTMIVLSGEYTSLYEKYGGRNLLSESDISRVCSIDTVRLSSSDVAVLYKLYCETR